jgi:glycosyltransferase involved in cell wall biosynthesis
MHPAEQPDISCVIPLYNEAESLPELHAWIDRVLAGRRFEVIYVDDGSKDGSWETIEKLHADHPQEVVGVRFARNYGKSAALQTGFARARGRIVVTLDADLQDSPDEIPRLEQRILGEGLDLISGWKQKRHDPLSKTLPTKLYNWATRAVSGIHLHDFNCGIKAYRLEVVKAIEVQGEMHRYIPILAKNAGFSRIGEQVVEHRARKFGTSKFGMERFLNGFLDLLTISFMSRFARKPMHLFGALGLAMFFLSAVGVGALVVNKGISMAAGDPGRNITEISTFYISLTGMVLGGLFFATGFLAEMVSRTDVRRTAYLVSASLGSTEVSDE